MFFSLLLFFVLLLFMERTRIVHSTYALVIVASAMFILVSIATFSPNDPPFGNYPLNNPVQNFCGKIGANVSGYLLTCLGATSYVFALLIGGLGGILLFRKKIEILWVKILGGVLLIASLVSILGMFCYEINIFTLPTETSGILGFIAADRLTEFLGIPGACILLALGFFISIMLISNMSFESLFQSGV